METENLQDIETGQVKIDVIQPINRDTVHRICSGQVVLSLAIAVKELVENSIDAGATRIEVHLKEYGSELIEVSDNGSGVLKENFQALTLKHYTSKIKQFSDLECLDTLGFRGEALSSLCALSDLTILTKHATSDTATKITYDRKGKISNEVLGAREQGSTVTLTNLFSTLPVRRKEFLKNLKREFNKMCQLLYAYCLVSKGIKFRCVNTTNKGSKNTVVATEGSKTVRENIINIFGSKQISSLIDVDVTRPEEDILAEYGVKLAEGEELPFVFEFLISSVMHGSGRSTTDRQFCYVNSRPCEPPKILKLINEIYRQYNSSQYPFVYVNIVSKSSLVDVNVTPDKRQVFFEKEKVLLATLKASLMEAFKTFPSTFKMQNTQLTQGYMNDFFKLDGKETNRGIKRSISENPVDNKKKKGSITERFQKRSKTETEKVYNRTLDTIMAHKLSREQKQELEDEVDEKLDTFVTIANMLSCEETSEKERKSSRIKELVDKYKGNSEAIKLSSTESKEIVSVPEFEPQSEEVSTIIDVQVNSTEKIEHPVENQGLSRTVVHTNLEKKILSEKNDAKELKESKENVKPKVETDEPVLIGDRRTVKFDVSLDKIREALSRKTAREEHVQIEVKFRSEIAPAANKSAEEELQKQISKEDFKTMTAVGQFNMGFIIAKLNKDLFIIDQHATDEKYNFEQLQATTIMESQVLVNPKPLQLTAGYESVLIENEEVFNKNGFKFKIDQTAPCTKKVMLTAIPLSKNWVFGKDDIDEMLFMLKDSNTMCRPTRVRSMFASRACRKSVMIGDSLSTSDMRKLIDHMGEIDQPWNCPHGRPTMRHLINLDLIQRN